LTDETHDPSLESWVDSANDHSTDFPIQNLPLGVFSHPGDEYPRPGIAIGDEIVDLAACMEAGVFHEHQAVLDVMGQWLNGLAMIEKSELEAFRWAVSGFLDAASEPRPDLLVPMSEATLLMPFDIGDYTDFYASIDHATNVGSMFRPDNPLLPNYKHVPIGYHGRASSIVVSGTEIHRPNGQTKAPDAELPTFGPSKMLDYECELGFFLGRANRLGEPIPIERAEESILGFCIVNDWSARDIQSWEYQPLGPFLAKSFATTISPWIVTTSALEPYRVPASRRAAGDPEPLAYLRSDEDRERGGLAITMEAYLQSKLMKERNEEPVLLSSAPFAGMYWTVAQMLTHHASNGCNLRPGDLMASGTVSGPDETSRGCLLELTWRGSKPVRLPSGEERRFLEDGDEVIMRAFCEAEGFRRIGFGECRGTILPVLHAES
jgi:fumarylacetoacetase